MDVIITDSNTPEMSGIEFIRSVRGPSSTKDIPVLMVTTNATTFDAAQEITAAMLGIEPAEVDGELPDAIGELANIPRKISRMVAGAAVRRQTTRHP